MALTIVIVMAFIAATVNGNFVYQNDDNFAQKYFKFHNNFPSFPKFPTFPSFPQINFPTPVFPTIPPIVIMTPDEVAKKSGGNYNGVVISASSSSVVDENGKVIKTGGGTIVTNNNGVVKEISFGDPPKVSIVSSPPIVIPQIPILKPMVPIVPRDPVVLRTYKPGKNENFIGTSSVIFSRSSDVNGYKTSAGGSNIMSNVNGKVDEKTALFGEKGA